MNKGATLGVEEKSEKDEEKKTKEHEDSRAGWSLTHDDRRILHSVNRYSGDSDYRDRDRPSHRKSRHYDDRDRLYDDCRHEYRRYLFRGFLAYATAKVKTAITFYVLYVFVGMCTDSYRKTQTSGKLNFHGAIPSYLRVRVLEHKLTKFRAVSSICI
ncbi:unnamed protein product [Gongylonema pulchrum]|uniref:Uncharacterized protein n=1 Tax=Gongylonema pulchrum TaxID=637853 RepID=A0A3P7NTF3_9BILA|nr:unnamed protein product [Gongylonema pulchrum]